MGPSRLESSEASQCADRGWRTSDLSPGVARAVTSIPGIREPITMKSFAPITLASTFISCKAIFVDVPGAYFLEFMRPSAYSRNQ